jgi:hypothetical protein
MNQQQLINSIKELKEIKPRKEWAVLLKSQILQEPAKNKIGNWEIGRLVENCKLIIENSFTRKLAYAFAAFIFVIFGMFGFARYTMPGDLLFPIKKIAEQSQASLTGQTSLKQNVASLNNRINDLAQVAKEGKKDNIPSAISEISANATELAKNLKDNPAKDPQTIKDIAKSLKTLADVPGTDLTENPAVKDLYQAVAYAEISDLEKSTLTEGQLTILEHIKDLYSQEKYSDALEEILLINDNNNI